MPTPYLIGLLGDWPVLILGFVLLYFGAEWLVGASSELALKLGISTLIIGLTVVAFGTSSPELLVSLQAALQGKGDMALGNVVGSNICNLALMLGIAALITPIKVGTQVVKRELPIMLLVTGVFLAILWDRQVERWEAAVLFGGIILYLLRSFLMAKSGREAPEILKDFQGEVDAKSQTRRPVPFLLFLVGLGVGLMALGADFMVASGSNLARSFGVSEAVIGLTLFALGTSLPELATTIVAAIKKEVDIITGNLVGSNIFNMLVVIGITGMVIPLSGGQIMWADLGMMAGVSLLLAPLMASGLRISRAEGLFLVLSYVGYIFWVFLGPGLTK
ncbi:MAG: calcium/sodium antiporter [Verrucomicrobiota bacterium]